MTAAEPNAAVAGGETDAQEFARSCIARPPGGGAGAGCGRDRASAYLAAGQTFESLKAEAAKAGDAPHLADPRVRDTLAVLSNANGSFGSASFPLDDEAMQRDLCGVPIRTAFAYFQFGIEAFVDEKMKEKQLSATSSRDAVGAALDELGERNRGSTTKA